jgi:transcription antitermination factor NusG
MPYWACAQLLPSKAALALHCLTAAGYVTYYPRLREQRRSYGRKIEVRPPLFLNYAFIQIELQWHAARWAPGVCRLVTNGDGRPAIVSETIISEIRARERNGLVELPKPALALGAKVRVIEGPLSGIEGLYAGMKPRQRVEVLLQILGGAHRVTLPAGDVDAVG